MGSNVLAHADGKSFDVVICGGGLAGLLLARQLRRDLPELSVALVERVARPLPDACHKVGESSVELGSQYLERLGLRDFVPPPASKWWVRRASRRCWTSTGPTLSSSARRSTDCSPTRTDCVHGSTRPSRSTTTCLSDRHSSCSLRSSSSIEPDPDAPRIRRGVTNNRRISIRDPDMRHGRKSKSRVVNGYKRHVAIDLSSGLVLAAAIRPANEREHVAMDEDCARSWSGSVFTSIATSPDSGWASWTAPERAWSPRHGTCPGRGATPRRTSPSTSTPGAWSARRARQLPSWDPKHSSAELTAALAPSETSAQRPPTAASKSTHSNPSCSGSAPRDASASQWRVTRRQGSRRDLPTELNTSVALI
jgi:hypothetical protein